jgi:uncharacterized protein YciI
MLFVYFMIGTPGMAETRAEIRPTHRAYLTQEDGRFFAAGPLTDDAGEATLGSMMIMDWPDKAAAEAWIAGEPYTKGGVFGEVDLWPKGGRPRVKDGLYAFHNLNGPDAADLRAENRDAHLDYLAATADRLFAAGPLMDDGWTGDEPALEHRVGTLYVVDFPDRAAAGAWIAGEPYAKAGVYAGMSGRAYRNLWPKDGTE